jgi:hypothetical protein
MCPKSAVESSNILLSVYDVPQLSRLTDKCGFGGKKEGNRGDCFYKCLPKNKCW